MPWRIMCGFHFDFSMDKDNSHHFPVSFGFLYAVLFAWILTAVIKLHMEHVPIHSPDTI